MSTENKQEVKTSKSERVINRLSNLLERDERELPRFEEYRHLMKVSRELNMAL